MKFGTFNVTTVKIGLLRIPDIEHFCVHRLARSTFPKNVIQIIQCENVMLNTEKDFIKRGQVQHLFMAFVGRLFAPFCPAITFAFKEADFDSNGG